MVHPEDEYEDLFGDDREPSPHTRRVAELLRIPGVSERWRLRCQESFSESRQRRERHQAWTNEREGHITRASRSRRSRRKRPNETDWVEDMVSARPPATFNLIRIRLPSQLHSSQEPFDGGPLPFSPQHPLSLADCYFVLALLHNSERNAGRIEAFSENDFEGLLFYHAQRTHLAHLRTADQLALGDCLAKVEADLQLDRPRKAAASVVTRSKPGRPPDPAKLKITMYDSKLRKNGASWKEIAKSVWDKFERRLSSNTIRCYVKEHKSAENDLHHP